MLRFSSFCRRNVSPETIKSWANITATIGGNATDASCMVEEVKKSPPNQTTKLLMVVSCRSTRMNLSARSKTVATRFREISGLCSFSPLTLCFGINSSQCISDSRRKAVACPDFVVGDGFILKIEGWYFITCNACPRAFCALSSSSWSVLYFLSVCFSAFVFARSWLSSLASVLMLGFEAMIISYKRTL